MTDHRRDAIQAIMARVARAAAHEAIDSRKRKARTVLEALRDGAAFDPLRLPAGLGNLVWSLPQEIVLALHDVEGRLWCERSVVRRNAAGAWYLKANPFLVDNLIVLAIALRWLRRHEHEAWAEVEEAV